MNLYRIDFIHYSQKDSMEGTWGFLLARDDEHLFDKLTHSNGPCYWGADDTETVWDDEAEEEIEANVKERVLKNRGNWDDEPQDLYYGQTNWQWECVAKDVSEHDTALEALADYGMLHEVEFPDHEIAVIAAVGRENNAIGLEGKLPWSLSVDLKRFKALTSGHTVIMGRKTWESIPEKFRPLPDRNNYVLSRDWDVRAKLVSGPIPGTARVGAFPNLVSALRYSSRNKKVFIIGGESLFRAAMPYATEAHITWVDYKGPCDVAWYERFSDHRWDVVSSEIVDADEKNSHRSEYTHYRIKA